MGCQRDVLFIASGRGERNKQSCNTTYHNTFFGVIRQLVGAGRSYIVDAPSERGQQLNKNLNRFIGSDFSRGAYE